jgi:hypothetical protein
MKTIRLSGKYSQHPMNEGVAAMAHDTMARKLGYLESSLNFPNKE